MTVATKESYMKKLRRVMRLLILFSVILLTGCQPKELRRNYGWNPLIYFKNPKEVDGSKIVLDENVNFYRDTYYSDDIEYENYLRYYDKIIDISKNIRNDIAAQNLDHFMSYLDDKYFLQEVNYNYCKRSVSPFCAKNKKELLEKLKYDTMGAYRNGYGLELFFHKGKNRIAEGVKDNSITLTVLTPYKWSETNKENTLLMVPITFRGGCIEKYDPDDANKSDTEAFLRIELVLHNNQVGIGGGYSI